MFINRVIIITSLYSRMVGQHRRKFDRSWHRPGRHLGRQWSRGRRALIISDIGESQMSWNTREMLTVSIRFGSMTKEVLPSVTCAEMAYKPIRHLTAASSYRTITCILQIIILNINNWVRTKATNFWAKRKLAVWRRDKGRMESGL